MAHGLWSMEHGGRGPVRTRDLEDVQSQAESGGALELLRRGDRDLVVLGEGAEDGRALLGAEALRARR